MKVGGVWIIVIPSGETYANIDTNAPVGSIALDPGNEAMYFKKAAGWKAITIAA
jgi:hypothetical protein